MTAPNLTPAEALECLRDMRAVDRGETTSTAFYDKWGTLDHAVWRIIAALEKLPSEHEATKAKLAAYEAKEPTNVKTEAIHAPSGRCFMLHSALWHGGDEDGSCMPAEVTIYGSGDMGRGELRTYRMVQDEKAKEPAAAVPSDEEIAHAIKSSETWGDKTSYSALVLLAKRIGVKL